MKKKIIAVSALMLILCISILSGTETRIATLGSENDLLIDDTNIYRYPSGLERFVERVIAEYGFYPYSDSFAYLAFYKEIGRFGNIGIVANKTGIPRFPETSAQTMVAQPDAVVNLFYALRIKDAVSIGLGGGYGIAAMNDDEQGTTSDVTNESSVTAGRASLTYVFGAADHFVELGGGIQTYGFTFKQGDSFSFENNNDMSTSFNVRVFYNLNDYASIVPYASYNTVDLSSQEIAGASSIDVKRIQATTRAGAGFNLAPFEENRIIIGVSYRQSVSQVQDAVSDSMVTERFMPELFGGIESEIRPWFVVRAGVTKSLRIQTIEIQNGIRSEYTYKSSPFDLKVGCGLRFGSFELDGVFHEDFRYTGGYLLSGKENPIFTKVSATYHF
jgi:hypothetical protein